MKRNQAKNFEEALRLASNFTSTNPARLKGLSDTGFLERSKKPISPYLR